jgi:hypothetical protein
MGKNPPDPDGSVKLAMMNTAGLAPGPVAP